MAVTVKIPTPLRKFTDGARRIEVEAQTMAGVLEALLAQCPGLRPGLYDGAGELRCDARLFIGSKDARSCGGLDAAVPDGETVSIVPPVVGA
jgi:molybdopterin converting factor small subunit